MTRGKVQGGYQAPGGGGKPVTPTTGSGVSPAPAPVVILTVEEAAKLRAEIERLQAIAENAEALRRNLEDVSCRQQNEVARLRAQINPLAMFARWAIGEGAWDALRLDGGDVQDKAEELGLITKTKYDPAIHGECTEAEPGDDWYVFTGALEPKP